MVNASFGQVRLVVRYAPLHHGSDTAVKILEAARQQGKYWEALERPWPRSPSGPRMTDLSRDDLGPHR
jgi:hypothetical protein